jgi:hypothetical protein
MATFNGLGMNLGNLSRLSPAVTRSISAENFTGEKGKGGMATEGTGAGCAADLGQGWKVSPSVRIDPGKTFTIADIDGPGAIQSMWMAGFRVPMRHVILRIYWDGQENPSVECPLADFFGSPWLNQKAGEPTNEPFVPLNSLPVSVNPNRGFNCFWEMPFRKHCRMTVENRHHRDETVLYYQVNYTLTDVPDDAAYFHAQFRRTNPLPYKTDYTILDGVKGRGHYVGTSMGWGINNNGWWGEGEIKFFMDGDTEFPTICGTGVEDYFGGAFGWVDKDAYETFTTPFLGMHQVVRPDGTYEAQHRHAMYRWHVMDPIRFEENLRVTMQSLGWRPGEYIYMHGQHDICSTAFWYQTLPHAPFPPLGSVEALEIS